MHVSTQACSRWECTTHGLYLFLRGFVERQKVLLKIPTILPSSPPAKGLSATVARHILNIHQCMILFPATNATGRQQRLFSVITQVASYHWSTDSRLECKWTLESKFPINIHMDHTGEQEREMIGSEISSGFESLTTNLFQPTNTRPFNRPVKQYRTTALWLQPYIVYYLKHRGPNLSLWRPHHRLTSFMKCAFHAACRGDQSSGSLAGFSLFRFPAPSPTDKMSQFKAHGSPIKIKRGRKWEIHNVGGV